MRGLISAAIFGLFGVIFTIVAMSTPMYQLTQTDAFFTISVLIYPFEDCLTDFAGTACSATASAPGTAQASLIRFVCALLFFSLFASIGGVAVSLLEDWGAEGPTSPLLKRVDTSGTVANYLGRIGRVRTIHLVIIFGVTAALSFLTWVIMVGNYYNSAGSSVSYHDMNYTLGPSPAMMIVSWLAMLGGIAVSLLVKERSEGSAPPPQAPPSTMLSAPLNDDPFPL